MSENTKPESAQNETEEPELKDGQLESVAGGVTEGGCIPPIFPPWKVPDQPWEIDID